LAIYGRANVPAVAKPKDPPITERRLMLTKAVSPSL